MTNIDETKPIFEKKDKNCIHFLKIYAIIKIEINFKEKNKLKKKLLSFIFAFCLIIPCIFLLSACGNDKKLNYIQVSLADGEYSASIYETRDFGNTTGLNNIKIKAYYSDGSEGNVELTNAQITVSFSADGSEQSRVAKTFEEYTQMCEDSNLTAGFWRLTLKYKDKSCEVNIDVQKVNDNSNYTLKVTSKVGNIGENQIYYGTKFKGIDYSVFNGNTQLDDSMIEKKIYILNKNDNSSYDISSLTQDEIKNLPKPNEIVDSENYHVGELSNELSNLEYIEPGKYLIFAEIKEQENYRKSYSAYQTLVVKKSQIVATAENFKIDFTFNKDLCKGVTLDEMLHGISGGNGYTSFGNSKISGKLSLLLRSDLNDENNNLVNDNKLTNETLIWHNFEESWNEADNGIYDYGTLAEVNPQTYNFDSTKGETNTITTKVKFVPKGYENWVEKVYAESKEFEITIILHRTAYSAPTLYVVNELTDFKYSTDNNGNPQEMKFDLYAPNYALLPYDATQPELAQHLKTAFEANKAYCIYTNAKFEKDETENYFCSSAVGSYFIRYYINSNLYYNDENLTHDNSNITITKHDKTGENEGYIEYKWTISKGDITEQQSLYPTNISFNTDNTVELKFGEYDSYKDVHFVWEALGEGTYKDKYNNDITSNITGRFEPIEGKNSNFQKFVLTTDLTTVGGTENYYNLFIRIYVSDDDNWNNFSQYLLVQIYKNN